MDLYIEDDLRNMNRDTSTALIIHFDDMDPKDTNVYQTQLMTLKFRSKLLCMRIRIKDLLLLKGKVELKISTLSDLKNNIYTSQINITSPFLNVIGRQL